MATKIEADRQMNLLLGTDVFRLLSQDDTDWCLEQSNNNGDYDGWYAAAAAADLFAGRTAGGQLVEWDSDGQRVKRTRSEWLEWAARWRTGSPRSGGAEVDFAFIVV